MSEIFGSPKSKYSVCRHLNVRETNGSAIYFPCQETLCHPLDKQQATVGKN